MVLSFESIGTYWNIELDCTNDGKLKDEIFKLVNDFDAVYSRFRPDSLVYKLKNRLGKYHVGRDFVELLKTYRSFFYISGGYFTPFSSMVLDNLGYDERYTFNVRDAQSIQLPDFDESIDFVGSDSIVLKKKVSLDFGAIGKGWLIDKLYKYLRTKPLKRFVINGGGDIMFYSTDEEKLKVFLEHPLEVGEFIGFYWLKSGYSICGSSVIRRFWRGNHHIIDPFLKCSTSGQKIASFVVSRSASLSDALSTLCLLPVSENIKIPSEFDSMVIYSDMSSRFTDGFRDCLF